MGKNRKSFREVFANQTELGLLYGISARAVGKILIEHGLKDSETKEATHKAISEGYAKSTPLKDGRSFFMWNIEKCCKLLDNNHKRLSDVEYHVDEIIRYLNQVDLLMDSGNDKVAYMMLDCLFDDVPARIRDEVEKIVESIRDIP